MPLRTKALDRLLQLHEQGLIDSRRQTLQRIGDLLGVSRERARQLLRALDWPKREVPAVRHAGLVKDYVQQHPEALVCGRLGGPGRRQIGASLGLTTWQVQRAWLALGLPPLGLQRRTEVERREWRRQRRHERYLRDKQRAAEQRDRWRKQHPERARALANAARLRWEKRVLREATCPICGATFPWTRLRESELRRGLRRRTCSRACTMKSRLLAGFQPS